MPLRFEKPTKLIFLTLIIGSLLLAFPEFFAPYDPAAQMRTLPNAPASTFHFRKNDGDWTIRPWVYERKLSDPLTQSYVDVQESEFPIEFLVAGESYTIVGLLEARTRLFGVGSRETSSTAKVNLLGTDALGRDRFSRLLFAIRFSLIVALLGVLLASLIGIGIGLLSGYSTRITDTILMSFTDSVLALPALILILGVRVAFPLELPPIRAGVLLVMIFAIAGWAEMARLTRGLVRATRELDYVKAAKATGSTPLSILLRHVLPNIAPALMTQATIMLPYFLLSEVALSFLGVGLQEPVPSLGNMLAAAADLGHLQKHPILLLSPAIVIFIFVLMVRLLTTTTERKFSVS
jgi:peptide/nickel transport system permease protein